MYLILYQIHIQALNIRVSYHDANLFLSIMNSLPSQMIKSSEEEEEEEEEKEDNKRNEMDEKKSKSKLKKQSKIWFASD